MKKVVSFTPEKHKLLSRLSGTDSACQINKAKINTTNDILITDSATIKKVDSTLKKRGSKMVPQTIVSKSQYMWPSIWPKRYRRNHKGWDLVKGTKGDDERPILYSLLFLQRNYD